MADSKSMYMYPLSPMHSTVVNMYGGPGCGKSTLAAAIFAEMKNRGLEAELVPEYAKKCVWEHTEATLNDQLYVFAKQHHMIQALDGQVDYIIVDSPLLLSTIYGNTSSAFKYYVFETYNRYNNINIFVERNKPWHPAGRVQTESEAIELDARIYSMLKNYGLQITTVSSDSSVIAVADDIMQRRSCYV